MAFPIEHVADVDETLGELFLTDVDPSKEDLKVHTVLSLFCQ